MTSIPAYSNRKFHLLTFGCQMNFHDSAWLAAALEASGFEQAPLAEAGFALVNTCSVREKPEQKVLSAVRRILQTAPAAKIAVLGCAAQQLGAELFETAPQIRLVAGGDNIDLVPRNLEIIANDPDARIALLDFSPLLRERGVFRKESAGRSVYVNIMQGCDNFCSYCIVPFTRGRQRSRKAEAVLSECRRKLAEGAVEIALLGQNVNVWADAERDFSWLLTEIASLPGLSRLRFVTPHPADFTDAIIAAVGESEVVCPALHLPLQAGSDRILKAMRRRYDSSGYLRLVEKLKQAKPKIALSTDLIVGFPGESEADFEDTLAMMRECGYASSFSFCYSDRPGTRASLMPDKIDPGTKLERLKRLQALQEELTAAWLARRIGEKTELLIEGKSPRGASWQGRDIYGFACHIDLDDACDHRGELRAARIVAAKKHCLVAGPAA